MGSGREHIMLVDDDRFLLKIQERILARQGYRVSAYDSASEALAAFRAQPRHFHLVITDQTMPKMTGVDLARELVALRPGLPMLLTTGFSGRVSSDKARSMGFHDILLKPVAKNDLAATVRRALDAAPENNPG